MADVKKTIEVVFQGTNKMAGTLDAVSKDLDGFSRSLGEITSPLAGIASKFEIMGAGIATAIGVGVGAAINATSDFDSAFGEIVSLIDAPIEKVNDFRDAVLEYARNSTQPLNEITEALYDAISGGVPYAEAIDAIRTAEELAVVGRGDFKESLSAVTGLLDGYGDSSDKAAYYADLLFRTVKEGKVTLPELTGKLGPLVSIASAAGVPFAELAAAIDVLTKKSMPVPQAIDAVRGAISNIITPSGQAAKKAEDLGIAFHAEGLAAKGLPGLMKEISEKTGDSITPVGLLFWRCKCSCRGIRFVKRWCRKIS